MSAVDLGIKEKIVIVMASSKGLGKATALEFAKEGATVIISSRNQQSLDETAAEIKEASGNQQVFPHVCDISKEEDIFFGTWFSSLRTRFLIIQVLL